MNTPSTKFPMPEEVGFICNTLASAGERTYIVGGAMRDMLTGRQVVDFDLATTASPEKVTEIFNKVIPTGIKHGTVTVMVGNRPFEVTTLRGEGAYSDGRRPDHVEFLKDIEADLARRDFTINAIAWNPITNVLHDPFYGRNDLESHLLKAVGNPTERFAEDGLRVLRAARFAATLEFDVEQETLRAMPAAAPALAKVSYERKRDELVKLLGAKRPSLGLKTMAQANLMEFVLPDLNQVIAGNKDLPIWQNTLARVDALSANLPLRLAALLHDTGEGDATSPAKASAKLAEKWLKRMAFDNKTIAAVPRLIRENRFRYLGNWSDTEIRHLMRRVGRDALRDLLALHRADLQTGTDGDREDEINAMPDLEEKIRIFNQDNVPLSVAELAIDGRELMQELGLKPGPGVGALLEKILEHALEKPEENTRATLLHHARELIGQMS